MLRIILALLFPLVLFSSEDRPPIPYDFLAKKEAQHFIVQMVKKHGFKSSDLKRILGDAKLDRDTLARYTGRYKQNTTVGTWQRFKAHVLDPDSLKKAEKFKKKYAGILKKAEADYHVDAEYIVGFIGVESKFGEYTGEYRLLDSLTTLAFHKNRMQKFFRSELEHFFLMCREEGFDPYRLKGSFAGAMGVVQQMPSVYRKYGMDYNGDGKKDPWSAEDGIGIIARFMHQNGWKEDGQVAVRADFKGKRYKGLKTGYKTAYTLSKLRNFGITPQTAYRYRDARLIKLTDKASDELWLGAPNFRILIRYNPSSNYAMAIHKIAQHVKHIKGSDTFFQKLFD
ncbi:MAG TPA: murein transglycosylase [Epsilonproteobacteria bacterium]|nr:murein transglycosylase [Campylobacterota bacterium]